MNSSTSQLTVLRRNLAALGTARRRARWLAAWSVVGTAVGIAILAFWALDEYFELSVAQRLLVWAAAVAGVAWTFQRLGRQLLGIRESEIDLALHVERQQDIDSDLVAALQFESPQAAQWGSPQLEAAVIRYVADVGSRIDVFAGLDGTSLRRRLRWFGVVCVVLVALAAIFPGHAAALLNRLLLGHRHYPTRTRIELAIVNQQMVLNHDADDTAPRTARAAQAHPVRFWIQCTGKLPPTAQVRLTGDTTHAARQLELAPVSLDQRRSQLAALADQLDRVATGDTPPPSGAKLAEALALLRMDAGRAAELWPTESADAARWRDVAGAVRSVLTNWPGPAANHAVYHGELGRLVDSVTYKLFAGDAWTDPAIIAMIALPVIEPRLSVVPPEYAAAAAPPVDPGARQISVLEGSRVEIGLECTNGKPLAAAWLTRQTPDGPRSLPLEAVGADRLAWRLPAADSPFTRVGQEVRFELQVRDDDQLQLELPISGLIRIRADRPPTAAIDVVHRVVLPTARPKIQYRVADDYGIGRIVLHVESEPVQNGPRSPGGTTGGASGGEDSEPADVRRQSMQLLPPDTVLAAADLPRQTHYELDLRPLGLAKGDRLKLSLEVTDYRGAEAGEAVFSDPLYLEISDESGVLAAILEADEKSEQRLTDIIKRQLGIGESP